MQDLANRVVVFDLDDTLYKERDYIASGRRYVYHLMPEIKKRIKEQTFLEYASNEDVWGLLCQEMEWPACVKESMLWAYRLHCPDIMLDKDMAQMISELEKACKAIVVLTDGRVLTQNLKLKALGLEHFPAYISESWDGIKPSPARFKAIEERWPNMQYVYVGDNPKKDFIAPNQLNWLTIGLVDNGRNIHAQQRINLAREHAPKHWISCLSQLEHVL